MEIAFYHANKEASNEGLTMCLLYGASLPNEDYIYKFNRNMIVGRRPNQFGGENFWEDKYPGMTECNH